MADHEGLHALASAQRGLLTAQQAESLGFSPQMRRRRLRDGSWRRMAPGVFLVAGAPTTKATILHAACLSSGGLASHTSAAALWQLGPFDLDGAHPLEVTIPRNGTFYHRDVRVHRSTDFELADPQIANGIPVTGLARVAVDLGGVVGPHLYIPTVDAIRRRGVTWPELAEVLVCHARRGRRGVAALRQLVDECYGSQATESALEDLFVRLLRDAEIPEPVHQHEITDRAGFVARVDFAYPDLLVAIELDGLAFHLDRNAFEADRAKRNRLRLAGWLVLEFTWEMVTRRPGQVCRQVTQAIERSRRS